MKRLSAVLLFGLLAGTIPAHGHHSFSSYYFADQSVSIEGNVQEFDYVNPHTWIHVLAPDKEGRLQKVSAEWAPPGRLLQQGIVRDTLKPGDHVIVTGSPSRDPIGYKIQLRHLYRPADGWTWAGRAESR
jgi:hypothetical protein